MLNWLWTQLRAIWNTIAHYGETVDNNSTKVISTYEGIVADTKNLLISLQDIRHFDFNPKWKTRVINVPRAQDGVNELLDIIFHGIRTRFEELHVAVLALVLTLKGRAPIRGHLPSPNGIMEQAVEYLGDLDVAWKAFGTAYHDAVDLVGILDDVKRRIETLDDLFLPQGNTKITVDEHYRKRQRS